MTMETTCPLCGRRTIDPVPVRERMRCVECDALVKAAPRLLQACKAVLHAIESADLDGRVLWILPPYQADAVHESANERLQAVIEEAEAGGESPVCRQLPQNTTEGNQTLSKHTLGPWMGHWIGDAEEVVDKAERLGLWGDYDDEDDDFDEEELDAEEEDDYRE